MWLDRSWNMDGFICAVDQVDLGRNRHRDGRNRLQSIPFNLGGGLDSYARILQRESRRERTGLFQVVIKIDESCRMTKF